MIKQLQQVIEAFEIFGKYANFDDDVIRCEDNNIYIDIDELKVSTEDISKLETLGFFTEEGIFVKWPPFRENI